MFARRAAPEVIFRDHDIAFLHFVDKISVEIFHAVFGKLLGARRVEITCGNDNVGIDVAAVFVNASLHRHDRISFAVTSLPATALAAAV